MKKRLATVSSALSLLALLAASSYSAADPHSDGLSVGKSNLNKLSSKVSSSNAKGMPFYTDKPPQSSQFGSSSLFDVGVGRINTCKTNVPGSDKVANQECDAVNFLAKNPEQKVKVNVKENDPIISGIGDVINNAKPGSVTDACTTKTTTTPDIYSTEVCNEYVLSEPKSCSMGQIVDVTANSNFQCNVTKNSLETVLCDRFLTVSCKPPTAGCSGGGIVPGSASVNNGSYSFSLVGEALTLSNSITAVDQVTSANFNFTIEGLDRVDKFFINSIHSDNWVGLSVNGKFIGVHSRYFLQYPIIYDSDGYPIDSIDNPSGWNPDADRLTIYRGWVQFSPDISMALIEAGKNLQTYFTLDLKPYLKEGANVINMKVVNGSGPGYGVVYITAHQKCGPECTDTWVNQCQTFEDRSL